MGHCYNGLCNRNTGHREEGCDLGIVDRLTKYAHFIMVNRQDKVDVLAQI